MDQLVKILWISDRDVYPRSLLCEETVLQSNAALSAPHPPLGFKTKVSLSYTLFRKQHRELTYMVGMLQRSAANIFFVPHATSPSQNASMKSNIPGCAFLSWISTANHAIVTLFLFTKSDLKTILIPVVSVFSDPPASAESHPLSSSPDCLRRPLRAHCAPRETRGVGVLDMGAPASVLRIQPGHQPRRGPPEQALAAHLRGANSDGARTGAPVGASASLPHPVIRRGRPVARALPLACVCGAQRTRTRQPLVLQDTLQCMGLRVVQCWCRRRSFWYVQSRRYGRMSPQTRTDTHHSLDGSILLVITVNSLVILTTIHAQDFQDEIGDRLQSRQTLPIVWPEASRALILVMSLAWSFGLLSISAVNHLHAVAFVGLGALVGMRFYFERNVDSDKVSYVYYNVSALIPALAS